MTHRSHIISDQPVEVRLGSEHALAPFGPVPYSWFDKGWIAFLPEGDLRVGLTILKHADARGECFPGIPAIMRESGLSHGGVHVSLNRLEACGLIARYKKAGKPTIYRVLHPSRLAPEKSRHNNLPVHTRGPVHDRGLLHTRGPVGVVQPVQPPVHDPSSHVDTNSVINEQTRTNQSAALVKEQTSRIANRDSVEPPPVPVDVQPNELFGEFYEKVLAKRGQKGQRDDPEAKARSEAARAAILAEAQAPNRKAHE